MNKEEALSFIGLKEPASRQEITARYSERKNYFQMLFENAPNKTIEKIQLQNLNKLEIVKQTLVNEMIERKAAKAGKPAPPEYKQQTEAPEVIDTDEKIVLGWLIIHTENKPAITFNLYPGVNYLGRKKRDDDANYIIVEEDPFISRTHAFIKCRPVNGQYEFKLYDGDGSKPSVNGVYLNGQEKRVNKYCLLNEDDTIQLGNTKLMFRKNKDSSSESQEIEAVLKTDYIKTIGVEKMKFL
jgi:hypothetical protein